MKPKKKMSGKLFTRMDLSINLFDDGWSFCLFGLFIPFSWKLRDLHPGEFCESWGFRYSDGGLHLNWNHKVKILWMPWNKELVTNEVMLPDGSWKPYISSWEVGAEPDGRKYLKLPYKYTTRSGEVQERESLVYVERTRYVWRWLKRFRWFHPLFKYSRFIDIKFNKETGERVGSWKGGVVEFSEEMLPGESVEDCLKRAEQTRKF